MFDSLWLIFVKIRKTCKHKQYSQLGLEPLPLLVYTFWIVDPFPPSFESWSLKIGGGLVDKASVWGNTGSALMVDVNYFMGLE